MARVRVPHLSWAHGEVSPIASGRLDLDQLRQSAVRLENFQVLETGAVIRRAGTRFVAETLNSGRVLLVEFIFSTGDVYLLEFGAGYLRFFKDTTPVLVAGVPLALATPYTVDDLDVLQFEQSNDVVYIACPFAAPRVLERHAPTVWKLRELEGPLPTFLYGTRPITGATLEVSAVTGTGITAESGQPMFLASDAPPPSIGLYRELVVFQGGNVGARARIMTVVDPNHVTADVIDNFATIGPIAAADWKITGSPLTGCTPGALGPENAVTTLTLDADGWRPADVGKTVRLNGGAFFIVQYTNALTVTAVVRSVADNVTKAEAGAWSLEEPAWSAALGFPAAVVLHEERLTWAGTPTQPRTFWGSKPFRYEDYAGGHLDAAAIEFGLSGGRNDGILWMISATRGLMFGTAGGIEVAKTAEGVMTPSNPPQVTSVSPVGSKPARPLRVGGVVLYPSVSGRRLIETVYDFISDQHKDPDLLMLASHLTDPVKVSGFLTEGRGLLEVDYQREPLSSIWGVRSGDGMLLSCTYRRAENVVAWARHPVVGAVERVRVVPKENGLGDRVWLVVRRTINGVTRRYIEHLDDEGVFYDRLHVDSAVSVNGRVATATLTVAALEGADVLCTASAPVFSAGMVGQLIRTLSGQGEITAFLDTTHVEILVTAPFANLDVHAPLTWGITSQVVTGLGHLEGQVVWLVGDGAPQSQQFVTGGQVAGERAIFWEVGLPYVSTLETQDLEIPIAGSSQGQPTHIGQVLVRVVDSVNVVAQGERVLGRRAGDPMDAAPPRRTGIVKVRRMKASTHGRVTVVQDQPLPLTVVAVIPRVRRSA